MNIDQILKYKRPTESYYDVLGCSQTSSMDQINREYKIRALRLHPDKNSDPKCVEEFRKVQTAKEVLTDATKRKMYDTWLNSGINIPFEQFQARKGHSMHWAPPRRNVPLGIDCSNKLAKRQDSESTNEPKSLLEQFRKYEI